MAAQDSFANQNETLEILNKAECFCGLFNDQGLNQVPKILRQKCPFPNKPDYGKRKALWKQVKANYGIGVGR